MSKAFTKDDAVAEDVVPRPRPPLPAGVPNYVTPRGLDLLHAEHRTLEEERVRLELISNDEERRRAVMDVAARVAELNARIASAEVIEDAMLSHDTVRFGAVVEVSSEKGGERRYRIVGVDEADPTNGLIAFRAPLALALLGKAVGDVVTVRAPGGDEELEIVAIDYSGGSP